MPTLPVTDYTLAKLPGGWWILGDEDGPDRLSVNEEPR